MGGDDSSRAAGAALVACGSVGWVRLDGGIILEPEEVDGGWKGREGDVSG